MIIVLSLWVIGSSDYAQKYYKEKTEGDTTTTTETDWETPAQGEWRWGVRMNNYIIIDHCILPFKTIKQ